MANNPETYTNRTALKNLFAELAGCRRVALKVLPSHFFVVYFNNVVTKIIQDSNYQDLIIQFYNHRTLRYSPNNHLFNKTVEDLTEVTAEIFNETFSQFNITNPSLEDIYLNYLNKTSYVEWELARAYNQLKPRG